MPAFTCIPVIAVQPLSIIITVMFELFERRLWSGSRVKPEFQSAIRVFIPDTEALAIE